MRMRVFIYTTAVLLGLCFGHVETRAQTEPEPEKSKATRFEIGAQFTSLSLEGSQIRTEPGFGGRFTYNFNDNFALEAQTDLFPNDNRLTSFRNGGRGFQGLVGVKAGKRYKNLGIFAKARPGFINFTRGTGNVVITGPPPAGSTLPTFTIDTRSRAHFVTDLGGVLEFYPSRRWVTRFDVGGMLIHYGDTTIQGFTGISPVVVGPVRIAGVTTLNFQFSAGIGYRF
jgi:hypothetical protein